MNEKERIKKYIKFGNVDKIPWQINCTIEIADKIIKSLKIGQLEYEILGKNIYEYNELDDFLGNHITFLRNRAVNSIKEIENGIFQDEWEVMWDKTVDKDIGVPIDYILEDHNINELKIPDPDDPDRYAHFQPLIEVNGHRYIVVKYGFSLFERAWILCGMENLMVSFLKEPAFISELLAKITDFNLKVLENVRGFKIDGIFFGDDWGQQRGLMMSPAVWREFIKPCLKIMYKKAHDLGYDVFIHSCGNITGIIDDLIEIELNVFNPFQPEVMDIGSTMKKYSHKLAFYGGISLQKTLPFGSTAEIESEIKNRIGLAERYGGLIISPSHDMPYDVPVKNIITMLDTLRSQ